MEMCRNFERKSMYSFHEIELFFAQVVCDCKFQSSYSDIERWHHRHRMYHYYKFVEQLLRLTYSHTHKLAAVMIHTISMGGTQNGQLKPWKEFEFIVLNLTDMVFP